MAEQHLPHVEIGIIGGTGVYGLQGMTNKRELALDTPFGKPSSPILVGEVDGTLVAFLARHDLHHRLLPSEIPYKANIYALKMLGVKYLLTFSACGSLQQHAAPQHIVLADQFIDRTRLRADSFFGDGLIGHVALGDPVCKTFKALVKESLETVMPKPTVHDGGTYVVIEGPAFSTKAESNMYRSWNCTVIGMTGCPEYKLAREAEMAYCTIAMVTDYDCWHPEHDHVTVELVMKNLKANGELAQHSAREIVRRIAKHKFESPAHSALAMAIVTPKKDISPATRTRLGPIIAKYV